MTKIRVFHLITRMIRGGADENTYYTVRGLNKDLYDVDVYAGPDSDNDKFEEISLKIIPHLRREIKPLDDLLAFFDIFRVMRKNRYHIVHTHTAKAGFLGRWAAFLNRVPIIIHALHGATFHESIEPWRQYLYIMLEKITARITDKMISVGDDLSKRYLDKGIGREGQYMTIRSGMELEKFYKAGKFGQKKILEIKKELGIAPETKIITQIARLEPRKGYRFFVDAAKIVISKFPDTIFLIAGEGDYRDEIELIIKKAGLGKHFLFLGYREDIEKIISISDLIVLTSLWEGLPRILVQASTVGKPVVTFAVEGAREVVKEGKNGFVVDIGDISGLAQKIIAIISNGDNARKMGKKGRKIVGDEWNVDTMVERIESLYASLTGLVSHKIQ